MMNMANVLKKSGATAVLLASTFAWSSDVDPLLGEYEIASGVSGNISTVGSDTLANLMTLWAEEFKRAYPNVNIQVQAAGSSSLITAV